LEGTSLGHVVQVFSSFMTEQDWFKLENTSSLSQDFICVCHSLNGLDTG